MYCKSITVHNAALCLVFCFFFLTNLVLLNSFCFFFLFFLVSFFVIFWTLPSLYCFSPQHFPYGDPRFSCFPVPQPYLLVPHHLQGPVFSAQGLALTLFTLAMWTQFSGKAFLSLKSYFWLLRVGLLFNRLAGLGSGTKHSVKASYDFPSSPRPI